jgi:hypothetical protein
MVSLNLNDTPGITEDDVRKTYLKCQRAVRLLQNPDFKSWRKDVEDGKERQIRKLISQGEGGDRKRGMIVAIEKLYSELEILASQIEELGQRLQTYEQRKSDPVDQRSWLR